MNETAVERRTRKPLLLPAVLAPFVAEVLSSATPITAFVQPGVFFSYGIFL